MSSKYDIVINEIDENTSQGHILDQIAPGSVVLECGCATGYMTRYMTERLHAKVSVVEYDREAWTQAMAYAVDGICADLSGHEWVERFSRVAFDVILFADVLEHLTNPLDVLRRAIPLLKEDGRVIVSLPNIAHNDVLLKLMDNRFDYTDIGLLDNTHIHFWGEKNLIPFFADAGLSIIRQDATACPAYETEQAPDQKALDPALMRALTKRPYNDAYQFIITAVKQAYASSQHLSLEAVGGCAAELMRDKSDCHCTLYFDTGAGFTASNTHVHGYDHDHSGCAVVDIRCTVPAGTTAVRIDPVEGRFCVVHHMEVLSNCGQLSPQNLNGIVFDGFQLFLQTEDPQFLLELPNSVQWIQVRLRIGMIDGMDAVTLLEAYAQSNRAQTAALATWEVSLAAQQEQQLAAQELVWSQRLQEEQEQLAAQELVWSQRLQEQRTAEELAWAQRLEALEKIDAAIQDELTHYKTHYFAAMHQREDLKRQLEQVEQMYAAISTAACWKLTRPLRWVLDACKRNAVLGLWIKGIKSLKNEGIQATIHKMAQRKRKTQLASKELYTQEELEQQRNTSFPQKIKFSILVPLYNTEAAVLTAMLDSVLAQTYTNWELCLADGSSETAKQVQTICQKYARKDIRIQYQRLDQNRGISGNTNACIDMSTGDYIALLDHDDMLHPAALFEVMTTICEQGADFIYTDETTFTHTPADAYCPHYKPDFAIDNLRANNYICHFSVFSKKLLLSVGYYRSECDGSQDYDMTLRLTEKAKKIAHIPHILYYWRASPQSVASDVSAKPYVIEAAQRAVSDHLERVGLVGEVQNSVVPSMYRIKYELRGEPLVSIIIPNKDHVQDLALCITSILEKTSYARFELIIVENNSEEDATFLFYKTLSDQPNIQVVTWEGAFNYSAINNFGVQFSRGEHIVLLNNDTEIQSEDWIQEMLMFSQRKDVGAVGAKLFYPDGTIQHAGVILGIGGVAGHSHKYFLHDDCGYMGRLIYAQNMTAVTAACMMIPRHVFDEVRGLDEKFQVAFNDIDLCMRIRAAGYLIVFTPYAELTHYESKSRGLEDTPQKQERFLGEVALFQQRWKGELAQGDPYYNPNFTLEREDFTFK